MERTLFADRDISLERDKTYLTGARDDSLKQQAFAEKEKAQAVTQRDWEFKQRQATADHYAVLQKMLAFNEAAVKAAIEANADLAREIAKALKEAADQVDHRTREMARYGMGAH